MWYTILDLSKATSNFGQAFSSIYHDHTLLDCGRSATKMGWVCHLSSTQRHESSWDRWTRLLLTNEKRMLSIAVSIQYLLPCAMKRWKQSAWKKDYQVQGLALDFCQHIHDFW